MPAELREGDVVRLKRRHPCGGWEWQVYRTGADIGMQCVTCGRRVMLERGELPPEELPPPRGSDQ
ncbi:MAG: DUF951 domain-containing protein [Tepidiforma sp.]